MQGVRGRYVSDIERAHRSRASTRRDMGKDAAKLTQLQRRVGTHVAALQEVGTV